MAKQSTETKRKSRWPLVWLIQAALSLALGILAALSLWLGGLVHSIFLWGIAPLAGLADGCAATRR